MRVVSLIADLWAGRAPLGRAFWSCAVFGGLVLSVGSTLLALLLTATGAPNVLVVVAFLAHLPWNLLTVVAVWRSADRYSGPAWHAQAARLAVIAWTIALLVV